MSLQIRNEMIEVLALGVLTEISQDIQDAVMYTITFLIRSKSLSVLDGWMVRCRHTGIYRNNASLGDNW